MAATETSAAGQLLKEKAYEALHRKIVRGDLRPGDRISERELAAELEMSKTPVKAALERLEEQGFVSISSQRRAVVRAMTEQEISDHYDLRTALESFVVARVAGRLDDATVEALTANLCLQKRLTSGALELEQWSDSDLEFHLTLVRALGNAEIERIIVLQQDRLRRLVTSIAMRDSTVPAVSCAEHTRIFEHVRDGRGSEAVREVSEHLDHGRRFLLHGGRYGCLAGVRDP